MNALISIPQHYPGSETLVFFWGTKNPETRQGGISVADAIDWEVRSSSFSEFSVFRSKAKTWRGAAEAERVRSLETTAGLFAMLGVGRMRLVLRQCLALSLAGLGIGSLIALPVALLLGSQFYGVSGIDPVTFAGVSALLLAVGLLAGYFPARRATRVDPIQALRHE